MPIRTTLEQAQYMLALACKLGYIQPKSVPSLMRTLRQALSHGGSDQYTRNGLAQAFMTWRNI